MLSREKEDKIKEYYTVRDIATEFQVTEKAVRGYIKSGKLKASKMFNKWVVSRDDLKECYNTHRVDVANLSDIEDGDESGD